MGWGQAGARSVASVVQEGPSQRVHIEWWHPEVQREEVTSSAAAVDIVTPSNATITAVATTPRSLGLRFIAVATQGQDANTTVTLYSATTAIFVVEHGLGSQHGPIKHMRLDDDGEHLLAVIAITVVILLLPASSSAGNSASNSVVIMITSISASNSASSSSSKQWQWPQQQQQQLVRVVIVIVIVK